MGDYNTPLQDDEKFSGSQANMKSRMDLLDLMNNQVLIDLDM